MVYECIQHITNGNYCNKMSMDHKLNQNILKSGKPIFKYFVNMLTVRRNKDNGEITPRSKRVVF